MMIDEWIERNKTLIKEIEHFLDPYVTKKVVTNYWAPFLVYCDKHSEHPFLFELEKGKFATFIVPIKEYDPDDWTDEAGNTFRHRVSFIISKDYRNGVWLQTNAIDLLQLVVDNTSPYHPLFSFSLFKQEACQP